MTNRLQNKIVLITGATSGIGRETAIEFAKSGSKLILTGRRIDALNNLQQELVNTYKTKVYIKQLDVREKKSVNEFFETIPNEFSNIDILINNAGLALGFEHAVDGDITDWETMIDTNILGLLYVTKSVLPNMNKNCRGHIINIGSVAGIDHYANGSVYCATKAAVHAFSRALREECIEKNIKVSEIMPGMTNTEFSQVRFHGDKERANNVYKGYEPLLASDIADLILYTANLPSHVNLAETVIMPTVQANAHKTYKG